ncbi:MAG: radical SAM protein [Sphingobacteriales bacterium]|jgi:uncharacterized protein
MKKFPILELVVKIASRCNFNCSYCYEYNMGDDTWKEASKFMSISTADMLSRRVQEHIDEFQLKEFTFGLHGGEPLLMPPSKLDNLVQQLKSRISKEVNLVFGLQTNAALMSEEFIQVFKKHNINISISLDGIKDIHDKHRLGIDGRPTHDKVIKGIELLQKISPELFVGLLSVIDIESNPLENFDFLASFGVDIDFLLPLKTHDNPPFYPNNDQLAYGKWYFEIYKEWINGRNSHVDVRFIKNIITQLMGGSAIYEVMTYNPIGLLTINTDGNMEGLDCLKSLGNKIQVTNLNINDSSFSQALEHEIVKVRQIGIEGLNKKCRDCDFLNGCAGGYFPNRYSEINQFDNPSVYCESLFWLLSQIEDDIKKRIPNELLAS